MKERPIIMSGDNPKLIQEGRKTQTRRLMASKYFKLEMCELSTPPHLRYYEYNYRRGEGLYESGSGPFDLNDFREGHSQWHASTFCPYGVAGDRLWVRETWRTRKEWDSCSPNGLPIQDPTPDEDSDYCRCEHIEYRSFNSDHVSVGDAPLKLHGKWRSSIHMPRWASRITIEITKVRVEQLWDSLHGKGAWVKNPWVFVIEFRKL